MRVGVAEIVFVVLGVGVIDGVRVIDDVAVIEGVRVLDCVIEGVGVAVRVPIFPPVVVILSRSRPFPELSAKISVVEIPVSFQDPYKPVSPAIGRRRM